MSCGVVCRRGSDLMLLWHRLGAVTPTQPLAWEFAYAVGAALKRKKKKRILTVITMVINFFYSSCLSWINIFNVSDSIFFINSRKYVYLLTVYLIFISSSPFNSWNNLFSGKGSYLSSKSLIFSSWFPSLFLCVAWYFFQLIFL